MTILRTIVAVRRIGAGCLEVLIFAAIEAVGFFRMTSSSHSAKFLFLPQFRSKVKFLMFSIILSVIIPPLKTISKISEPRIRISSSP
jgi:hypothetical protein